MSFPVVQNGKSLAYPFAGGLNNAQISPADLNGDGVQDLVIFDRGGDAILTFVNNLTGGTEAYRYRPEFSYSFPSCKNWMLLRDFDKDGAADIFCSSLAQGTQEVQVFKGYFQNGSLRFRPFKFHYPGCATCNTDLIYYPDEIPGYWNNLPISVADLPAVDDVDCDGDLDIVTFEASVGGHVWFIQNMSVERGFGLDSLQFRVIDKCWGGFYESGLLACKNSLSNSPDSCASNFAGGADDRDGVHPGSTLMTYDQDGDGDKELVLGDISFACLNMMVNGGNCGDAWMTAQDAAFPSYSFPVDLLNFPAAFYLDIDNDGKNDLIACPNSRGIIEDINCVWYYPNSGSNSNHVFDLEARNLFTRDMIETGSISHPAIADVNGDGLLDIVVGNSGYLTTGPIQPANARLVLFLNTGSPSAPRFERTDADWLGMSQFAPSDFNFTPAFGDLDGDGDLDLLVGGNGGWLYHYENVAGAGNSMDLEYDANTFWLSLDVGGDSAPQIVDLDGDGKNDLVIGERRGNINFFKNTGTVNTPVFAETPTIEWLGKIDVRVYPDLLGYTAPAVLESPDGKILVTGSLYGKVEAYRLTAITADSIPLISKNWGGVDDGARSHPAFADLNSDGILDMVTGNLRGGLNLYATKLVDLSNPTLVSDPVKTTFSASISPNPAIGWARVSTNAAAPLRWRAVNTLGQIIATGASAAAAFDVEVADWTPGVYLLTLESGAEVLTLKLAKR